MAEFTGERVIPGKVDPDLLNEHLARYAFAARLSRGKRVLDAGCGAGYGSAELAKTAWCVVGADTSAEAVEFAREHYRLPNLTFEQASCSALPHADSSFDLVVAFEVIEHLAGRREFLLEVKRVLAPNGQFIVSTPNKVYYAESRSRVGPNPFHEHEYEFSEFRDELAAAFPQVSIFLENHVESVIFRPLEQVETAEVRVDGADAASGEAHFFVAVCAHRQQTANPTFVYIPSAANVLRERERHIDLLETELQTKNGWLEDTRRDLQAINEEHTKVLRMLEESNRWAEGLDRKLHEAADRIQALQEELAAAQAKAQSVIAGLEAENLAKTQWALEIDERIKVEIEEKSRCLELLHATEKELGTQIDHLRRRVASFERSRWTRLGRRIGFGPDAPVT